MPNEPENYYVVAAHICGYCSLIMQCRNVNGAIKRGILDTACMAMGALRSMSGPQLKITDDKFRSTAQSILGADGLDEDEIRALGAVQRLVEEVI